MSSLHPGLALPGGWKVMLVEPKTLRLEKPVAEDRADWRKKLGTTLGAAACTLALVGHAVLHPELALVELPVALLLAVVFGFGVRSVRSASRDLRLPVFLEVVEGTLRGTLASREAVSCRCKDVARVSLEPVQGVATKGLQLRLALRDGRTVVGPEVYDAADTAEVATLTTVGQELSLRTAAPLT